MKFLYFNLPRYRYLARLAEKWDFDGLPLIYFVLGILEESAVNDGSYRGDNAVFLKIEQKWLFAAKEGRLGFNPGDGTRVGFARCPSHSSSAVAAGRCYDESVLLGKETCHGAHTTLVCTTLPGGGTLKIGIGTVFSSRQNPRPMPFLDPMTAMALPVLPRPGKTVTRT
ncbi:hypothetical protein HPP92_021704 [Vanilla planifolia]|uniref:Uncharacterized protein n=1 Tax=Vanilla planifolia TaxID=51239 RepID=A0A835Q234_VANPL|nr:hypothetical protein HPP92_021704 [Vanilla planifolia]